MDDDDETIGSLMDAPLTEEQARQIIQQAVDKAEDAARQAGAKLAERAYQDFVAPEAGIHETQGEEEEHVAEGTALTEEQHKDIEAKREVARRRKEEKSRANEQQEEDAAPSHPLGESPPKLHSE